MLNTSITRRTAMKAAIGFSVPFVFRKHLHAKPSETVLHASFGASSMAAGDINSLTASRNLRLVAVADVDLSKTADIRRRFPEARITLGCLAPTIVRAPSLGGVARVGGVLSCAAGTWSGAGSYTYEFLRNGSVVQNSGTTFTRTLAPADLGASFACRA